MLDTRVTINPHNSLVLPLLDLYKLIVHEEYTDIGTVRTVQDEIDALTGTEQADFVQALKASDPYMLVMPLAVQDGYKIFLSEDRLASQIIRDLSSYVESCDFNKRA